MERVTVAHYEQIKDLRKEDYKLLFELLRLLNEVEYQDSLMQLTLDIVLQVVGGERGLFARYNAETDRFDIVTARNLKQETITDIRQFSSGIIKKVFETKQPCIIHDAQGDPDVSQFQSVHIRKIKSVLGVPIINEGIIWGVLLADSQEQRKNFTEENRIFLEFISNLVSLALEKLIRYEKLKDENRILAHRRDLHQGVPNMIGESPAMQKLAALVHKVAQTDAVVMILGESGTGKDLIARAIHALSKRCKAPFLAQFCGSIPDTLLESELFGYKKGAFTGADGDKKGLFEVAHNGTFFLDEIADISPALQAKLLRVLQNKEFLRLGDTEVKKVDVRIITATNQDLQKLIKEGKFREDLFYRLNVVPISIPPLRDRRGDIVLLAKYFLEKHAPQFPKRLHPDAAKKLERYRWPGNVRQLENVLQRATILSESDVINADLIDLEGEHEVSDFRGTLEEYEIKLLKKRLEEFNGNRTLTAKSLDVSVRWVQLKLKEIDGEAGIR
jgi:Nif-specific regulatory protein